MLLCAVMVQKRAVVVLMQVLAVFVFAFILVPFLSRRPLSLSPPLYDPSLPRSRPAPCLPPSCLPPCLAPSLPACLSPSIFIYFHFICLHIMFAYVVYMRNRLGGTSLKAARAGIFCFGCFFVGCAVACCEIAPVSWVTIFARLDHNLKKDRQGEGGCRQNTR